MENTTQRKKLNAKTLKLSELPVGAVVKGKFLGYTKGQEFTSINPKGGEIETKALTFANFEDEGERLAYVADKGFQDALTSAMVKEGQSIEVVKMGKQPIGKGRTMNQYDVYGA